VRENANPNIELILVGNKRDLNDKREVSEEDGQLYAK